MRPNFPPQTAHRFAAPLLRCRELLRILASSRLRLVITRCSQSLSLPSLPRLALQVRVSRWIAGTIKMAFRQLNSVLCRALTHGF
jgi:hypothetical protein